MKVLVTGGAGYIGSIAVEQLIEAGDEVVVFDNLYQGHRDAVHPAATFVRGDLRDRAAIDAVLAEHRPDGIMHFASYTLVGESMAQALPLPGRQHHQRAEPAPERGRARGEQVHPVLHGQPLRQARTHAHRRDRAHRPRQPLRRVEEHPRTHALLAGPHAGLRYACLRYFNASGASATRGEHHDPETHIIPLILQVALGQREHFSIFGDDYPTPDGTCIRDYIHVVDLAQAHILALRALDGGSRTYNLGNGQGFSVKEVVETARQITGHPIPTPGRGAAAGRSCRARGQQREDPPGAGLGAALPRSAVHRRKRVGLAQQPPGGVRTVGPNLLSAVLPYAAAFHK